MAWSFLARSRSMGPVRAVRSRVGSPFSSSAQDPIQTPAESRWPRPFTRVARRAGPPLMSRAVHRGGKPGGAANDAAGEAGGEDLRGGGGDQRRLRVGAPEQLAGRGG